MRSRRYLLMVASVVVAVVVCAALLTGCPPAQQQTGQTPPEAGQTPPMPGGDEAMAEGTPAPAEGEYTVGMRGDKFTPQELTAPAGTEITFVNDCVNDHTVTPDVEGVGPNSDTEFPEGMKPGDIYKWTVPETAAEGEDFYYYCRFHGQAGDGTTLGSGMAGEIVVGTENTE